VAKYGTGIESRGICFAFSVKKGENVGDRWEDVRISVEN
jgi:hypothetical protein